MGEVIPSWNGDGVEGSAAFIFTNCRTFQEFARALRAFCEGSYCLIGSSVRLETSFKIDVSGSLRSTD